MGTSSSNAMSTSRTSFFCAECWSKPIRAFHAQNSRTCECPGCGTPWCEAKLIQARSTKKKGKKGKTWVAVQTTQTASAIEDAGAQGHTPKLWADAVRGDAVQQSVERTDSSGTDQGSWSEITSEDMTDTSNESENEADSPSPVSTQLCGREGLGTSPPSAISTPVRGTLSLSTPVRGTLSAAPEPILGGPPEAVTTPRTTNGAISPRTVHSPHEDIRCTASTAPLCTYHSWTPMQS